MRSYAVHCNTITIMLYIHISQVNVVLNPPHCEAAGMMESSGSFLYTSLWRRIHATDNGSMIFIGCDLEGIKLS